MLERRKIARTEVLKTAQIALDQCSSVIHCNVCNLTSAGACLEITETLALSQLFDLSFDSF
jgi:hypothetical protein